MNRTSTVWSLSKNSPNVRPKSAHPPNPRASAFRAISHLSSPTVPVVGPDAQGQVAGCVTG